MLLRLMPARQRTKPQDAGPQLPSITLIIACRNEAGRLRHKLDNVLALDYPDLEILVASDASDDASDDIVREYASKGVQLVRSEQRRGKEYAQGLAINVARGEILVFSDAGTDLPADSMKLLADAFSDPGVGAVSSEDVFVSADGRIVGEGAYVRYEMWLRRLESERAGLVGLSGSFFAVRRSVISRWDHTIPSDFACALQTVHAGLVAVADPRVKGVYRDIKDPSREYGRKLRTAVRGMTAVARWSEVLNPFRYGAFAFQVWGHKVMRWLVPWFMALLLLTCIALAGQGAVYMGMLAIQLVGYALVLLAHLVPALRQLVPVRIAYFFVQANLALAHAALQFLGGRRIVTWEPSAR
ncbi:MAG: glycosyltransferase [Steroidobacteraceae bacterium]|nr:glycosyltransferase [Steroidobacteraceae bacterium]